VIIGPADEPMRTRRRLIGGVDALKMTETLFRYRHLRLRGNRL